MEKTKVAIRASLFLFLIFFLTVQVKAGVIPGYVYDKKTHEPLIGASIFVKGTKNGTTTDIQGHFVLNGVRDSSCMLTVSYVSYKTAEVKAKNNTEIKIELIPQDNVLNGVSVTTKRRLNNDTGLLLAQRNSSLVESGISLQQITRSQDRNATEVVRRVPGISIIDDKFVIVRGLSQRYNNVWINGAAVPSTEADSRAFSFNIIPAAQLSNMIIIKSPAPELPADFTGGLIKITTRDMPVTTGFNYSISLGANFKTIGKDFLYNPGSSTDLLGFDSGKRSQDNNDWSVKSRKSLPDMRANFSYSWKKDERWAVLSSLNYSYENRVIMNMENARYGIYNASQDKSDCLYNYYDDQYSTNVHIGGLLNATYKPNNHVTYELKQIVNQIGKDQYTMRDGYQYISGEYIQKAHEYNYYSRCTYSAQLSGTYLLEKYSLDWEAGYSYANKKQPDRRIINSQQDVATQDSHYGEMKSDPSDISREKNTLNEDTYSATLNFTKPLQIGSLGFKLKTGLYSEYRTRQFHNKAYVYLWDIIKHPEYGYGDDINVTLLNDANVKSGSITLDDETDNRDSYKGHCLLNAAYAGLDIPMSRFHVYTGARFESNRMTLVNNLTIHDKATKDYHYNTTHLFPSVNISYSLTDRQLLRVAYGATVNRPEFREVSPSTYYDFDLYSMVKGNTSLKTAYIQNLDLRYEFYPHDNETINFALFYKHFSNPIEWTYLDAGGTYTYTFENANSANNFGMELEIKKNLDFLRLPAFTFLFNASLIHSRIKFDDASLQRDRAMQGQSPYIVNAGLFYNDDRRGWSAGALYNRVGKRIVGVGRVDTSSSASVNNDIPDAYEMPRDVIDLSVGKKITKTIELKLAMRDLLSQDVVFKQYPKYYDLSNVLQHRSQVTKRFNPGTNVLLTITMSL
jgi:TonB-dependent receptor